MYLQGVSPNVLAYSYSVRFNGRWKSQNRCACILSVFVFQPSLAPSRISRRRSPRLLRASARPGSPPASKRRITPDARMFNDHVHGPAGVTRRCKRRSRLHSPPSLSPQKAPQATGVRGMPLLFLVEKKSVQPRLEFPAVIEACAASIGPRSGARRSQVRAGWKHAPRGVAEGPDDFAGTQESRPFACDRPGGVVHR